MLSPSKSSSAVLKGALVGSFFIHVALFFAFMHWVRPVSSVIRSTEQPLRVSLVMQGAETIEPVAPAPISAGIPEAPVVGVSTIESNPIPVASEAVKSPSDKVLNQPARVLSFVDITLPQDTLNLGGLIKIQVDLNEFGKPVKSSILEESPQGYFGEWGLEMIKHGTYEAARQNGVGIASTLIVMFTIESGGYQSSVGR